MGVLERKNYERYKTLQAIKNYFNDVTVITQNQLENNTQRLLNKNYLFKKLRETKPSINTITKLLIISLKFRNFYVNNEEYKFGYDSTETVVIYIDVLYQIYQL